MTFKTITIHLEIKKDIEKSNRINEYESKCRIAHKKLTLSLEELS